MKRRIIIMGLMLMALISFGGCENQYEKDSKSGFEKFTNGDFDSMTDGEKRAVNDFLEWANEN